MMHTPAHKSGTAAQTLSDYIKDVVESEKKLEKKKLTFNEWWILNSHKIEDELTRGFVNAKFIWDAAQENM